MISIRYEPNAVVVQIPKDLAASDYFQNFLAYLRVESILEKSQITEAQVDELSEQVKADWWTMNKAKFIKGSSD